MPPLLSQDKRHPDGTAARPTVLAPSREGNGFAGVRNAVRDEASGGGLAESAAELIRRCFLVEPGRIGLDVVAPPRGHAHPRDAARRADDQPAVVEELEAPAAREGLDPVVPAAQAAEVPALGRATGAVWNHVVDVAAAHAATAAGHAAVPVVGLDETALMSGGAVTPGP